MKSLVILTYHGIYNSLKEKPVGYNSIFSIEEKAFEKQLISIKVNNNNIHINNPTITISFDDGFESDFETAFPLLQKINLKARFFINNENINNENRWVQYRQMIKYGHSVGSHGMTHMPFTKLTKRELIWQFEESKKIIEDKTNSECIYFSFPFGAYNNSIIEIGKSVGYKFFYSTRCLINNLVNENIFHRFQVKSHYSTDFFNNLLQAHGPAINYLKLRSGIGFTLKRLFNRF